MTRLWILFYLLWRVSGSLQESKTWNYEDTTTYNEETERPTEFRPTSTTLWTPGDFIISTIIFFTQTGSLNPLTGIGSTETFSNFPSVQSSPTSESSSSFTASLSNDISFTTWSTATHTMPETPIFIRSTEAFSNFPSAQTTPTSESSSSFSASSSNDNSFSTWSTATQTLPETPIFTTIVSIASTTLKSSTTQTTTTTCQPTAGATECPACGTSRTCFEFLGIEPPLVKKQSFVTLTLVGRDFPKEDTLVVTLNQQPISNIILTDNQFITLNVSSDLLPSLYVEEAFIEIKLAGFDYSATRTFQYFDPSLLDIQSAKPARLDVNVESNIEIQGNFTLLSPQYCIFQASSGTLLTVDPVVNDTMVTCKTPFYSKPDLMNIHLLFYQPEFSTPEYPSIDNLNRSREWVQVGQIQWMSPAPSCSFAIWSDSGSSVTLKCNASLVFIQSDSFNPISADPVKVQSLGSRFPCSSIFAKRAFNTSSLVYNIDSDCFVTVSSDATQLTLTWDGTFLLSSNSILPGQSIRFLNHTVVGPLSSFTWPISTAISIQSPENPPVPVIELQLPVLLSVCQDLELDFSSLTGSASRFWKSIEWISNSTSLDSNALKKLPLIQNMTTSIMTLPAIALPSGRTRVNLTVTNLFDKTSQSSFILSKSGSKDIPNVILGRASDYMGLDVSQANILSTSVLPSQCSTINSSIVYQWKFIKGPSNVQLNVSDRATLTLPRYSMLPGSDYEFSLTSRYRNVVANATSVIKVSTSPDTFTASAGRSVRIAQGGAYRLAADIITRSYPPPLNMTRYKCIWSCSRRNTTEIDFQSNCPELDLSSTACHGIALDGQLLKATLYQFNAQVENIQTGVKVVAESAYVQVDDSNLFLSTEIETTDTNPGAQSSDFYLKAIVHNVTNSIYTYWTSELSCFGKNYSTIALDSTTLLTSSTSHILKFKSNQLESGSTYCFQVDVFDSTSGARGRAWSMIKVRDRPQGGTCSVVGPTLGQPLSTLFTFSCTGWTTDIRSYPLNYEFHVRRLDNSSNSNWSPLRSMKRSNSHSTVFMSGKYEIRASIIDAALSTNQQTQIMSILVSSNNKLARRALSNTAAQGVSFLGNKSQEFQITTDSERALQAITTVSSGIDLSLMGRQDIDALQSALVRFYGIVLDSGTWSLQSSLNGIFASSVIKSFTPLSYYTSRTIAESIFNVMVTTQNQLNASDASCYPQEATLNFLTSLDTLLYSLSASKNTSSTILSDGINMLLNRLNACALRNHVCQQQPLDFTGNQFMNQAGLKRASVLKSACQLNISLAMTLDPCVRFDCQRLDWMGLASLNTFWNTSDQVLAVGNQIVSLSILQPNGSFIASTDVLFKGSIQVKTMDLLESALASVQYGNATLERDLMVATLYHNNPLNAVSNATLKYQDIQPLVESMQVDNSTVQFSSNQFGSFVPLFVQRVSLIPTTTTLPVIPPTLSPTPIPQDSPSTSIVIPVAAGVGGLVIILLLGCYIHRRRKVNYAVTERQRREVLYQTMRQQKEEKEKALMDDRNKTILKSAEVVKEFVPSSTATGALVSLDDIDVEKGVDYSYLQEATMRRAQLVQETRSRMETPPRKSTTRPAPTESIVLATKLVQEPLEMSSDNLSSTKPLTTQNETPAQEPAHIVPSVSIKDKVNALMTSVEDIRQKLADLEANEQVLVSPRKKKKLKPRVLDASSPEQATLESQVQLTPSAPKKKKKLIDSDDESHVVYTTDYEKLESEALVKKKKTKRRPQETTASEMDDTSVPLEQSTAFTTDAETSSPEHKKKKKRRPKPVDTVEQEPIASTSDAVPIKKKKKKKPVIAEEGESSPEPTLKTSRQSDSPIHVTDHPASLETAIVRKKKKKSLETQSEGEPIVRRKKKSQQGLSIDTDAPDHVKKKRHSSEGKQRNVQFTDDETPGKSSLTRSSTNQQFETLEALLLNTSKYLDSMADKKN